MALLFGFSGRSRLSAEGPPGAAPGSPQHDDSMLHSDGVVAPPTSGAEEEAAAADGRQPAAAAAAAAWDPAKYHREKTDLEMRLLCAQEQLHSLSEGMHPDMGELLSQNSEQHAELCRLRAEATQTTALVQDVCSKRRPPPPPAPPPHAPIHSPSQKETIILKLRSIVTEQDARLAALRIEHDGFARAEKQRQQRAALDATHNFYTTPSSGDGPAAATTTTAPFSLDAAAAAAAAAGRSSPTPAATITSPRTAAAAAPVTQSLSALRETLEERTVQLLALQASLRAADAGNAALRAELEASRRSHASDVGALQPKLLAVAQQLQAACDDAAAARADAAAARDAAARAREQVELRALRVEDAERGAALRGRHADERAAAADARAAAAAAAAGEAAAALAALRAELAEGGTYKAVGEVERLVRGTNKKWAAVVEALKGELERQGREQALFAGREERKNALLQEYHAALVMMEEERDELLAGVEEGEEQEEEGCLDSIPFANSENDGTHS